MKKVTLLLGILALALVSCKNDKKEQVEKTISETHSPTEREHKGPPPGHDGGRKGPPRGGGPEQTKTLEEIGGYKIGDIATDFSLKNVDGSMVSLASFKDAKGYIVTFTCNGCPFSKMYEDRLIELDNKYASKGYPVIAINPNSPENEKEGYAAMQQRAKDKSFPFPYLVDEGQKIYPQYGAVRTPHVFLLDENLAVQYIGSIDDNAKSAEGVKVKYIENAIEALENGKKPDPNFTKAIGCPVKASRA